ncbi:hypothetical protein F2Q69_00040487 [Brassica cretica]|uniref:Uncharacterized protein n=1 Tax=Brassica cretica TaxID=69181 RepID=A0A8S9NG20_BRACR|nr:hypothetical protein F2Q69_00040487 [Brassica cretica]
MSELLRFLALSRLGIYIQLVGWGKSRSFCRQFGSEQLVEYIGFAGTFVLTLVGCAADTARKIQDEIISQKYKNIA